MSSLSSFVSRYSQDTKLEASIVIPPHQLRYNLKYVIRDRLTRSTRNKCTEKNGFILDLKHIAEIRGGVLDKRSGAVNYTVEYIAETLRPETGDIVEAIVSKVFKIGVFADLGPLNIFIPYNRLPLEYEFVRLNHFAIPDHPENDVKVGSIVHIKIEKIEMLDDNFLPSNSTRCVLKGMGRLIGAQASLASISSETS